MNKLVTTYIAITLLSWCTQKSLIEVQKDQIIEKMNQVLTTKKEEIKNWSECIILVEWVKGKTAIFAGLRCDDGTDINGIYEQWNTETYTTLVSNIRIQNGKLLTNWACMQIISTDPKNPNGPKRSTESADCPKFTV